MFAEKWKRQILTIPNFLSLFRIILIPVFITVYLGATTDRQYMMAGAILAVSCLTDLADGIIARKFHMITQFGKILDPLADKLTQLALILSLTSKYKALYPILMLFLIKEIFQLGALLFFARQGKGLPGALFAGKICTTVLFISLILLVLFPQIDLTAVMALLLVDVVFLLYSFGSYFIAYFGRKNCLTDLNTE